MEIREDKVPRIGGENKMGMDVDKLVAGQTEHFKVLILGHWET